MPIIKTKREDILRRKEIEEMLKIAEPWLQCYIGLLWAFGKRCSEVVNLKTRDVWIQEGYLYARFYVGKKRKLKDRPFIKTITLQHPAIPYILPHWQNQKEERLFPHMTRQLVLYYLKKTNPNSYSHLFRHSLATEMSERSYTVQQLTAWFDWENPREAMIYVMRGPALTKELSNRIW